MLLKDKVVIVSGIGPGLGVKLAVEAARAGARGVMVAARSADKLEDAEARIRALGGSCRVVKVPTDITEAAQCTRLAERCVAEFGRIDGLVNSAFFHGDFAPLADIGDESWERTYATNLMGSVRMTLAVAPQMKAQGGGAIVMINTLASFRPFAGEAAYASSKAALLAATKYLAQELGPSNIRVNTARMSWMWGAPVQGYVQASAKAQGVPEKQITDAIAATIPLRRLVTDDECARAALMLLSDYASAVTGATLDANGGEVMA
jgi:NAD(P)-dependent dehydrogenase (short-subunit alcohol dehydrogenase family)